MAWPVRNTLRWPAVIAVVAMASGQSFSPEIAAVDSQLIMTASEVKIRSSPASDPRNDLSIVSALSGMMSTVAATSTSASTTVSQLSRLESQQTSAIVMAVQSIGAIETSASTTVQLMSTSIAGLTSTISAMSTAMATAMSSTIPSQISTAVSTASAELTSTWATQDSQAIIAYPANFSGLSYYLAPDVLNLSSYQSMILNSTTQTIYTYTCDGGPIPARDRPGCAADAEWAYVSSQGLVHPGNNNMYIVARFTVPSHGFYGMADTMLVARGACSRGVHLLVFVAMPGNGEIITILDQTNRIVRGNVSMAPLLGFLPEGAQIHVAVGPDGDNACDTQVLSFAVIKRGLLGIIQQNSGTLLTAINAGHNAGATSLAVYPSNWNRFTYYYATDISSLSTYTWMPRAGGRYTCGGGPVPNNVPGCDTTMRHAFFGTNGIAHPGSRNVYVIAQFNVTTSGFYRVVNSVRRNAGSCTSGTHMYVQYFSPGDLSPTWQVSQVCAGNPCTDTFNTAIGALTPGSKVQIALGPGPGGNACDGTQLGFEIQSGPLP